MKDFRLATTVAIIGVVAIVGVWCGSSASAEGPSSEEKGFLATWKLLKSDEKKQFVAGYLYGWADAAKVTDVAIDYVRDNPAQAVDGLAKIRSVYDMQGLKADTVVRELDSYFAESTNRDATMSQAITAVRSRLGR